MPQSPDRVCVWRIALIPAAVVTTATHVPITADHLEEAPYIGFLFVLLEAAGLVLAVLLMRRDDRLLYVACAAVGGLAILAYILSRSLGLPQIRDDVGNWAEPLGVVAVAAEAVLLFGGLAAASGRLVLMIDRRVAAAGVAVMVALGIGVTIAAEAAEPSMADHAG